MLRVGECEKRALMMIKPPCQFRRARILEIHDRIFIAVENVGLKRLRRFVDHSRVTEIRVCVDSLAVKPGENCRRSRAVETLVVKTNPDVQFLPFPQHKTGHKVKPIKMAGRAKKVKGSVDDSVYSSTLERRECPAP